MHRRLCFALLLLASCGKTDEQWIRDLDDPDPFARGLAAIALCQQAPERSAVALPVLLETVDRSEVGLERQAASALARVGPFVVDELVARCMQDEFMTIERRQAVENAIVATGPRALPALTALAEHEDLAVRATAAKLLQQIPRKR